MNKFIDFTKLEGLAVYQDTLAFLQESYREAFAGIAKAFGQFVIITGVIDEGTSYSEGWVVINGELMPFAAGLKADNVIVEELVGTEVFSDDSVQDVYYTKRAKSGSVGGEPMTSFVRINTIAATHQSLTALIATVSALAVVPTGMIAHYPKVTAPAGWLLCQGQTVSRTDYAALFDVIGITFGAGDGSTTFTLPNGKGKFIVGYDNADADYNAIGKTGGEKKHLLTGSEIPAHSHSYRDTQFLEDSGVSDLPPGLLSEALGGEYRGLESDTDNDRRYYRNTTTSDSGGGQSHENRPPFITFNMFIKF